MGDDPRAAYIASSVASLSSVGDTKALAAKVKALDDVDTFVNDPSKRLLRVTVRRPGPGKSGDGDDGEAGLFATTSLKVDSGDGDADDEDGTVVVKEVSFVKVTSETLTEDSIASAVMVVSGAGKSSAAENLWVVFVQHVAIIGGTAETSGKFMATHSPLLFSLSAGTTRSTRSLLQSLRGSRRWTARLST